MTAEPLLALLLGYLLGSIPFGLVLTRLAGKGDVRDIGSGNIGATNVLRTESKPLAAATLILYALKATAAILLARSIWQGSDQFAAAGALIGLARRKPTAELDVNQDLRLFLGDVLENLEGSNCDPRMVARLQAGLAGIDSAP